MKTYFCFYLLTNYNYAQTIQKVNTKIIGLNENLSSLNVRKIIQDKNGFFWFSTQDGLNKYDGKNITKFTVDNISIKRKLLGSDCFNMEYGKMENQLYVLNGYEGLNIIDVNKNTVKKTISTNEIQLQKSKEWLKRMVKYKHYLIIATPKKIIFFDTKQTKTEIIVTLINDKLSDINFIEISNDKLFAALSNGELITYNLISHKIIESQIVFNDGDLSALICNNNYLWASTSKGIKIFDFEKKQKVDPTKYFQNNGIENITTNSICFENGIQYISNANGFYSYNSTKNELLSYKSTNNITGDKELKNANSIFLTKTQIYIGGAYGVAICNINSSPFASFYSDVKNNKSIEHTFNLKPTYNNKQLVCTEDGVYISNPYEESIEKIYENDIVLSGISLGMNEYIYSGTKGLYYYLNGKKQKAKEAFPELKKIQNDWLIYCEQVNENKIIFVSQYETGIYIWDRLAKTLKQINKISTPSINDLLINSVVKIDDDNVLIISETEINKLNLSTLSTKLVFKKNDFKFLSAGVLMDICKQANNYYVGAYGLGLIKFDKDFNYQKLITSKEGMNNIGIYKVFSFKDSLIAITTNNGLSIYNANTDKVQNYFEQDGLHNNAFEETSGYQRGDSIFVGGIKGYTIFNTKNYATNKIAPQLYFDICIINTANSIFDTTNLFLQNLTIPNNYTQAKISFIGLNYQNPTRINYWYRITELGKTWIDLKNQNFIDLIGIAPGKYHLEVKAANEDGVECVPIKLALHFLPKWHQTLLFKILVALSIALLLYVLYSFRIKQLKKVLTVRQKISQNLHDDIGSTLSAINMYTQVAKLQPQENHFMDSIEENTKEVLGKLDDIIWSTNPKNDKVQNLVERMEGFAMPLCRAKNVAFVFNHSNIANDNKISEATRQNVFVIFKEAVNNALKYSQCTTCTITLEEKNKNIYCSITDDGKGFDTAAPTERNGLLNMELRTKELKGTFKISSTANVGTKIDIILPL